MYSVILVEDELLIRMGMKNSINWDKYDMEVVADFTNGRAAFEYYEAHKPDIIITDLRMRVMDGMELISKIREKDSETRIIILTCLEEFELVRKALSLGVSDYMLKLTMSEEEIDRVLRKTRDEIKKMKTETGHGENTGVSATLEKEKFFKDFLFYNLYSADEFDAFTKKFRMNLVPDRLVLCVLDIDDYDTFKSRFEDKKGQLIRASMLNVLGEVLGNCKCGEAFYDEDSRYILIFSLDKISSDKSVENEFLNILMKIRNAVNMCFNITVSIGVCSGGNGYNSLIRLYEEAQSAMQNKFFSGPGMTCYAVEKADRTAVIEKMVHSLHEIKMVPVLRNNEVPEFKHELEVFLSKNPSLRNEFEEFYLYMVQWVSSIVHPRMEDSLSFSVIANEEIKKSEYLYQMSSGFSAFINNVNKKMASKKQLSNEIMAAKKYLENNYKDDIKLQNVAENIRLSPNYLGYLFKKELSVNITEYLTQLRIEKAKELLRDTNMKSYQIAEATGFSDNAYFSKVFKKAAGMNPNEFRKQWTKDSTEDKENEVR